MIRAATAFMSQPALQSSTSRPRSISLQFESFEMQVFRERDKRRAGLLWRQPVELFDTHDDDRIAATHGHALGPFLPTSVQRVHRSR